MLQWLYKIKPTINISVCNDYVFKCVCEDGYIEIAQWLYSIKPTIVSNNYLIGFNMACNGKHLNLAQWLYTINQNNIAVIIEYNNSKSL
jgi:hypothetical protein